VTIQERVQRGIELLDAKVPGWASRINLDNLQLSDCVECVLGQLFGRFSKGADELGLDYCSSKIRDHGFDAQPSDATGDFQRLQKEWVRRIQERKA
jgi:hypothetical protein